MGRRIELPCMEFLSGLCVGGVKVKLKFQVRPQDDGEARAMGFPLEKSAHRWSGPKRWAV